MVQFLSINFFSWISSIFVGFFKSSRFFVSLCIRQAEIHTVEPLVPEPSAFGVELAIENLKNHRSPGIDQIPAELT